MTSGRIVAVLAIDFKYVGLLLMRLMPVVESLEAERGVGLGVFACMLSVAVPLLFICGLRRHRQNAIASTATPKHLEHAILRRCIVLQLPQQTAHEQTRAIQTTGFDIHPIAYWLGCLIYYAIRLLQVCCQFEWRFT